MASVMALGRTAKVVFAFRSEGQAYQLSSRLFQMIYLNDFSVYRIVKLTSFVRRTVEFIAAYAVGNSRNMVERKRSISFVRELIRSS